VIEFWKKKKNLNDLTRKDLILPQSYIIFSSEQLHRLHWDSLWFTSAHEMKIKPQYVWETEASTCRCDVAKVVFCPLVCWLVSFLYLFLQSQHCLCFQKLETVWLWQKCFGLLEGDNGFNCFKTVFVLKKIEKFGVMKEKHNYFFSGLKMFQENVCFAWKCNSYQNREI